MMKHMKLLCAASAAVIALNALCIPAAAVTVPDYGGDWTITQAELDDIHEHFGPFYTLGEDVSAYESGDITMDGRVDLADCTAIMKAYNYVVLIETPNYLTEEQIQLGNVVTYPERYSYPVNIFDAAAVLRYLNFRDVLGEPCTMEEAAAYIEKGRIASRRLSYRISD